MVRFFSFLIIIVLFCGCSEIVGITPYQGECISKAPAEVEAQNAVMYLEAMEIRNKLLNEKRAILGAAPLGTSERLTSSVNDPYPNSVGLDLSAPDLGNRLNFIKYMLFHGWVGAQTYYQTTSTSGIYFIVDQIEGILPNQQLGSWHSWHSTPNNGLVRAKFAEKSNVLGVYNICGCGDLEEVDEISLGNLDYAPGITEAPSYGIFKLPGSVPAALLTETFNIEYEMKKFEIRHIPKVGKSCRSHQWAC